MKTYTPEIVLITFLVLFFTFIVFLVWRLPSADVKYQDDNVICISEKLGSAWDTKKYCLEK